MLTLVDLRDPRRTRSLSHEPSREFSASCRAQHSVLEVVKFRGSSLHLQTGKPRKPRKRGSEFPEVLSTTRRCEIASVAKQGLLLNVVVFLLFSALALLWITIILIPLVILAWIALGIVAIALPILGAVKASDGNYHKYPVVGIESVR